MDIRANIESVKNRIFAAALSVGRNPGEIVLVAASKTNSAKSVAEAAAGGITVFGENRVQEMLEKKALNAYEGTDLHFIGHLQKNKVKQVVGRCELIQSVDSPELLSLIDLRASELGICQQVLLEINIAGEASKSGFDPDVIYRVLEEASGFSSIWVRGLMAIPPISLEPEGNRAHFARMYKLFIDISAKKYDNISMDFLSMGMSGDFENAIAEGSNMVRVGSAIFGARPYPANTI